MADPHTEAVDKAIAEYGAKVAAGKSIASPKKKRTTKKAATKK